ncbi:MAG: proteasome assembly chaperone family protein [Desulfurococcales archaeon]|nr:proteasome assembly chaperone family protein [Desulfurococcales archaeon]
MRGIAFEEEIYGFTFREYGDVGKPRYLILGLPDVGLVGSIASMHIIRSLKVPDVAGIENYTMLPPVVVIQNGEPKHPMRVYSNRDIAFVVTDVPISPAGVAQLSMALVEWARLRGIDYLISVTGIGHPARVEVEKPSIYLLASSDEASELAKKIEGGSRINDGILVGPYAIILKEAVRRRVPNLVLMVESFIDMPDPEAAARAVEALSPILGAKLDVEKLLKEAELIKLRLKELMKETKSVMARMGKGYEYRTPLMYT